MYRLARTGRKAWAAACLAAGIIAAATAAQGTLVGSNLSAGATAYGDAASTDRFKDQMSTQWDSGTGSVSYAALVFAEAKTFDKIIVEHTQGWVIAGFEVQVANTSNPVASNDAHWTTIPGGSYSGLSSGGQFVFSFNQTFTSEGVRIRATDKSNIADNRMRTREIWVWENYSNLAPAATVNQAGWAIQQTTSAVNNEQVGYGQAYRSASVADPAIMTFTWADAVTIGAIQLNHGTAGELNVDYKIQYNPSGTWLDLVSVTGNTSPVSYHLLATPVTTDDLRIYITKGHTDGLARLTEVWILEAIEEAVAIPEPASALMVLAGAALLARRRRKA